MPIEIREREKTWLEILKEEEAEWLEEERERDRMARELLEGDLFAALYSRQEQLIREQLLKSSYSKQPARLCRTTVLSRSG